MLLDTVMPRWDVTDRHAIAVGAAADRTYDAVRHVDFAAAPIARLLLALRNPLVLLGRRRVPARVTLDDAVGGGFVILAEEPGREIVLGVAGRFWALSGGRRRIAAADFATHA